MLVSLPFILIVLVVLGVPPVKLSRSFITVRWWDYALPATGLPVWILLISADIGMTASLSNMVIEVFWVLVASIVAPWARYLTLKLKDKSLPGLYYLLYLMPGTAAILLRLNMPTLPE